MNTKNLKEINLREYQRPGKDSIRDLWHNNNNNTDIDHFGVERRHRGSTLSVSGTNLFAEQASA